MDWLWLYLQAYGNNAVGLWEFGTTINVAQILTILLTFGIETSSWVSGPCSQFSSSFLRCYFSWGKRLLWCLKWKPAKSNVSKRLNWQSLKLFLGYYNVSEVSTRETFWRCTLSHRGKFKRRSENEVAFVRCVPADDDEWLAYCCGTCLLGQP